MDVIRRLTIPDSSKISLMKYPIIARLIINAPSPIAEWEINLNRFVKRAPMNPQAEPIVIEAIHR
jgi:hypothetical protein